MAKPFLGSGLKFPINNKFESSSGVDKVLEDIQLLLLTRPSERVTRPTFGCNLSNRIWYNLDDAATYGASDIASAINTFEPRVKLIEVVPSVNYQTGLIFFNIRFIILDINQEANLVFPFKPIAEISQA